jgi:hypothetical protein
MTRIPRSPSPELRQIEHDLETLRGQKDKRPGQLAKLEKEYKKLRVKESERELEEMREELEKLRKFPGIGAEQLRAAEESFRGAQAIMDELHPGAGARHAPAERERSKR